MDAKQKYYVSVSLHLFAGLVFGYVAGSIGEAKTFLMHITECAELS